ncbi:MAG TPA: Gfo/Idh/MocA family oxidoreductase [Chloroflexota bacterium]|nr:Gfo/Idh/MocA family oxidoreductase [Chloroflexota bacterium]
MSASGELGFALIGCGGMGKSEARILAQVPRARLVAVCDVSEAAAGEFGAEMGVPALTDHREALARRDVDAVLVATPNGLHTQIVLDACAARKHVFCEKPFAFTVAECDAMMAAADANGVKLMVGHVLRLLPLFQRVIDIFDSGVLGTPITAQITRIGWLGDPKARYRLTKKLTGGLLYDITVHEIDVLHRLCGPVESVYALLDNRVHTQIDYEDVAQIQLRFRSGASGHLFASLASPLGTSNGTIVGDKGTLRYDHGAGQITYRRAGEGEETVQEAVTRADGENGYLRELRSFTEWVLDGSEPLLTAKEGRAAIQVAEAAYRSAETGQVVRIEG